MDGEGVAAGSCVYLDLENGPPMTDPLNDYVGAWCDAGTARGHQAGTHFPVPDPAGSGHEAAVAWQRGQNCQLTLLGAPTAAMTVDLDVATTADPGAP